MFNSYSAHHPAFATWCGALAQLGERLLCKHQVIGSIPIGSTTANDSERGQRREARHKAQLCRDWRRAGVTRFQIDEDTRSAVRSRGTGSETLLFDIVNGFLKSMPWRYGFGTTRIAKAVR